MSDEKLKSLINIYSKLSDSNENRIVSEKSDLDILKAIMQSRASSRSSNISKEEKVDLLQKRYDAFTDKKNFSIGDLVMWKPGLRNKGGLAYEDTAIITEIIDPPIFDQDKDSGSPYFREPLDLIIAFLDEDNDFITLHVDSRRLTSACNALIG